MSVQCILSGGGSDVKGSQAIESSLLSANWTKVDVGDESYYYQDVTFPGYKVGDDGIIGLSQGATFTQRKAAIEGVFGVTNTDGTPVDGVIRVTCDGKRPSVNIPVTLIVLG